MKSRLTGKAPNAGKDCRQEEKGTAEDTVKSSAVAYALENLESSINTKLAGKASTGDLANALGRIGALETTKASVGVYSTEQQAMAASQADPNKICLF